MMQEAAVEAVPAHGRAAPEQVVTTLLPLMMKKSNNQQVVVTEDIMAAAFSTLQWLQAIAQQTMQQGGRKVRS